MAAISKRGKGFRIKVSLGYDMNGRQIIKSTTFSPPEGISEKKAQKLAQEYAYEFERHCKGYTQLNENMRFSELADWYFKNYAPVELKEGTVYNYISAYKKHVLPVFGNARVKDINTPRLTEFVQSLKLHPETVRKVYVIIQSIFRRGVEQGFIRYTPCRNVILPKNRCKKKKPVLDENQARRFLKLIDEKKCDPDVKRMIKVLLYTGMRSGECLALSWKNINFDDMTISIEHNLADVGGRHWLTTPKTESSIRSIGMSEALADIFKEQKQYQDQLIEALGDSFPHPEMVFTSSNGNYRDRSSLCTSFKRFLRGTEFEFLTLHSLRHCNATLLLNSGVDLKIVSDHLGHCDIGVTANIYADVLKSSKEKVANLVALKLA
ncbi:MAG: site-specific integrase [Oscillospiraceae bacterium]|nr:site-specific integrase [Oscillospiraceae bacterium]MBP1578776.1 site-specific integrase [Oscillospiraceae bacterium]